MPCGELRDLFEERAVDVLPQADGRDGDAVVDGLLGEGHAVALFGDAIGEQHDVFVDRVHGRIFW